MAKSSTDMDDALQVHFEDGYENGILRGIEPATLNIIGMGISLEKIHEATKLPMEHIRELANKFEE